MERGPAGAGMANVAVQMSQDSAVAHKDMANAIRALAMDAVEKAKSGHPGMPMGMADVATVLFTRFLKFDAAAPNWPDRDRFVLSAGHGSMLLYALLHLTGYPGMTMDQLSSFRQLGSKTAGHPEFGHAPGIETTTGPLGQGLGNAVGMALGERLLNARLGEGIVDHYTYAIVGDGCLMEGISHEAISLAGHLKLNKLIVIFDDNAISIDGPTSLAVSDDQVKRFEAAGWATRRIDGHDPQAIAGALEWARRSDKPTLIAAKTIIGYGAPTKQGKASTHGEALGPDEIKGARDKLGWAHAPFEVPADVLAAWRAAGARGSAQRKAWEQRAGKLPAEKRGLLGDPLDAAALAGLGSAVAEIKAEFAAAPPKIATRVASQKVLEKLTPALPCLIGGSADLTGSNGTRTKHHTTVVPGDFSGNYIHYGVREHAMAAAMNGLALHGGVVPYGGTFLVFTDYCRPAIRLSAIMGQRVVYVMTHDSIGLGEDGPTHQPIEHLASLRAMPNLSVFRPADPIETAECWELALKAERHALDPGSDAPGGPRAPEGRRGEPVRQGRLRPGRDSGQGARRHDPGHRLGGRRRHGGARAPGQGRHRGRGGVDAVLGTVRGPARCLSAGGAGRRPARCRRSRREARLGAMARRGRRLRGHGRLRGLGTGGQALRALRHHACQGCRRLA